MMNFTNFWRFNINLQITRAQAPASVLQQDPNGIMYRFTTFDKRKNTRIGILVRASTIEYLREIIPPLAIRHMSRGTRRPCMQDDEKRLYTTPLGFHMSHGICVAEMLFNQVTPDELYAPYSKELTPPVSLATDREFAKSGAFSMAEILNNHDFSTVKQVIRENVDNQMNLHVYEGDIIQWQSPGGIPMGSQMQVFYNQYAEFPFTLRTSIASNERCKHLGCYPANVSLVSSLSISLTPEEMLTQMLMPLCDDIAEQKAALRAGR